MKKNTAPEQDYNFSHLYQMYVVVQASSGPTPWKYWINAKNMSGPKKKKTYLSRQTDRLIEKIYDSPLMHWFIVKCCIYVNKVVYFSILIAIQIKYLVLSVVTFINF